MRIERNGRWETRLVVPAGAQHLKVGYESEPAVPEKYPSHGDYLCAVQSTHEVAFEAEPGKTYRFDAARETGGGFVITAYEVYAPPNARPIATSSLQLSARSRCRFYPAVLDCAP